MAEYSLTIKASAAKELECIEPKKLRRAIIERIRALAAKPRPPGCEKLSASEDLYRVRQGPWRIVYRIQDTELVVIVIKVGHRRDVYKRK